MKKYRKKPLIIEAEQWGTGKEIEGVCPLLVPGYGRIDTLEGPMTVAPGDWVIKGVAGELYPCKDEIFRASYEEVKDE